MNRATAAWRLGAGAAILALLLGFAVLLAPTYYRNLQFKRSLETIARDSSSLGQSDDSVRAVVLERAERLGLPVHGDQVRLRRSGGGLRIEVRYSVPIDVALYTVDLHFRPSGGR